MGTRSLTVFIDRDEKESEEICVMYRQFDGYPGGHGLDLAEFLASRKLVNGYSDDKADEFNGMGCVAASVICAMKAHAKTSMDYSHGKRTSKRNPKFGTPRVGGVYIHKVGTRDAGEDYIYYVKIHKGELELTCCKVSGGYDKKLRTEHVLFCLPPAGAVKWIEESEKAKKNLAD